MNAPCPIVFSPLLPGFDFTAFVAKLAAADMHARFGRLVAPDALSALLAPGGPDRRAFGAWRDGSLAGAALLAGLADGRCEYAVLVRSDMQRRRIGTALTRRAFDEARALGADGIVAHVRADNIAARALLRSTGFSSAGGLSFEMTFTARVDRFGPRRLSDAHPVESATRLSRRAAGR